jgi:hypothetical protein
VVVENWLQDGAIYGEEGATLAFDALLVRTADLRSKVPSIISGMTRHSTANLAALEEVISEAQGLQYSLTAWVTALPEHWNVAVPSLHHSFTRSGLEITSHLLQESDLSFGRAVIWNRFHAVRLLANSVLVELLSILSPHKLNDISVEQQLSQCRESMGWMAADLCSSIAFLWKSFNTVQADRDAGRAEAEEEINPQMAVLMVWPLILSVGIEGLPEEQNDYLRSRLKMNASVLGDEDLYAFATEMT